MTVVEYYTKLKMLWDELLCLMPIPEPDHDYDCGVAKELADMMLSRQLMEFFTRLHNRFDSKSNIVNEALV